MTKRDRKALLIGIALGIVSATLSAAAVFFFLIVFAVFVIVNPLVVSLIADKRIITLGTVPNLIMAMLVGSLYLAFEGELLDVLFVFAGALVPALVVSGIVKVLRRRKKTATPSSQASSMTS